MNQYLLIPVLVLILFPISCNRPKTHPQRDHPPLSVQVDSAINMDISDSIQIFGMVQLRHEASLASQFDGRLKDFSLLVGDKVTKGQKIGTIVPPMREALNQSLDVMSPEQREIVASEINEIPLVSPINGTVLDVTQNNGDVLQKGESIIHIANLGRLDIYGDLPVAYLQRVRQLRTLKVSFINYHHEPIYLPVSAFDGKVHPEKQTIQIRLALNNPDFEFKPGMMVKLVFPDKIHPKSLVVPRTALLEEEGVYSVFSVQNDQAVKRMVQIGIKHDDFVEILSGLHAGELVISSKAYSLIDGMKISSQ